ncbi:hypothetical protein PALI_a1505 [Pseudoalteromonas aliena SW19]|uniref:Uncharacterized protein n=1 Tax=Pseudoalteromonas aliena SW19 TaxID=1314866 RepID=A0ABR9DV73_9GAMM|nr:hypothetical protein [Pseudoalteromonas aliena SW19]
MCIYCKILSNSDNLSKNIANLYYLSGYTIVNSIKNTLL